MTNNKDRVIDLSETNGTPSHKATEYERLI